MDLEQIIPFIDRHLEKRIYEAGSEEEQQQAVAMAIQDIEAFTVCGIDTENELYCAAVADQTIYRLRNRNRTAHPAVVEESVEGAGSVRYSEELMARTLSPRALFLCRKLNAGIRVVRA